MTLMVDYSIGFGAGGGFQPTDISSSVLWLRADLGITLNGSDVSDWADQSAEGNDFTQATAADQPVFVTSDSAFGGQPVVLFSSSTEMLDNTSFTNATTQPFTVYTVVDQDGAGGGNFGKFFHTQSADPQVQFFQDSTLDEWGFSSGAELRQGTIAEPWSARIMAVEFNNTASELWDSGVSIRTGTTGTNVIPTGGMTIGNRHDNVRFQNGAMAEIIMYDKSLSNAEHNLVGNYLADRYGLSWTDL
jgi:hypothetical protein